MSVSVAPIPLIQPRLFADRGDDETVGVVEGGCRSPRRARVREPRISGLALCDAEPDPEIDAEHGVRLIGRT